MTWPDVALVAVIALSVVLSLYRGFVKELLSLVSWGVAFWAATQYAHRLAGLLEKTIAHDDIRYGVAFLAVFVVVLVSAALINRVLVRVVRISGLGGADRAIGALFGMLRGVIIVTVFVVVIGWTPLAEDHAWRRSVMTGYLNQFAGWAIELAPPWIADRLHVGARL